jgi:phage-related minor tail protein
MTKYEFSYVDLPDSLDPGELKLNGGFEMADVERARLELKQTQKKLAGKRTRPEDNPAFTRKQDAVDALHETLQGQQIKQNSIAKTLKEARIDLKRTQKRLAVKT